MCFIKRDMQVFIILKPIPVKMLLKTFCLWSAVLNCIQLTEAKCSQRLVEYWERQYHKNYVGDLEPWTRCKAERGTCMRKTDTCDSGDWQRYQTTCDNRCDCCFREKRMSVELDWVLVKTRRTWDDAREDCFEKDGDLVVPENIADLISFMQKKKLGSADVWVGINDKFNGRFEGIYGNEVLGGWMEGQPERIKNQRSNCVVVEDSSPTKNDMGMKVEPCWAKNYYVCDVDRSNRRRHDVYYKEDDEEDEDGENSVVATLEDVEIFADRKTWEDAREDCIEKGGDLLVPHSMDDLILFMRESGIGERDMWLGITDHDHALEYEGIHGNQILDDSLWQLGQPQWQNPGDDCVSIEDDVEQVILDDSLWQLGQPQWQNPGDDCVLIEDDVEQVILDDSLWQVGQPQWQNPGDDCVSIEDDIEQGAGLKVKACNRRLLYACDLSDNYMDVHVIAD